MLIPFKGKSPKISEKAFIIGDPFLSGDMTVGDYSSIWPNVTARADVDKIVIGKYSNVQDNCVLHCENGNPLIIGDRVTIGHSAVLHGCIIGDMVLIGIGAIVLSGAQIGNRVILGAGSLVPENRILKPGKLYLGAPARAVRDLTEKELDMLKISSEHYVNYSREYV